MSRHYLKQRWNRIDNRMKERKISLLDCTLRDGGCVNDFDFGIHTMGRLLQAVEQSGIPYAELGYLDKEKGEKERKTKYDSVEAVRNNHLLDHKKAGMTYLVMIDYGKYPVEELPVRTADGLDGIRLCFHKKDREKALLAGKIIREKGYQLILQAMVCTRYSDEEFESLLCEAAEAVPDLTAMYIVDSFGCMTEEQVCQRLLQADRLLPEGTAVGLHTHNNQNLSLQHAVNAAGLSLQRDLMIDGTLYGMGKGAGNLNTEVFAEYLNKETGTSYDIRVLHEIIHSVIRPLHRIYRWGYCQEYLLSSRYHLTPSYAKQFYRVRGLSMDQTEQLLSEIPEEKRDSFDRGFAEDLLESCGFSRTLPKEKTLLDARGYTLYLETDTEEPVTIVSMGAAETDHPGEIYDQDPYVTAHVKNVTFTESYRTVLKDTGIRKSGLRIIAHSETACTVRVIAAGESVGEISLEPGAETEKIFDVSGLCREETAYLQKLHRILYRLLEEVDRICRKHGIHYYLIQGGLLGAVRHGEIIPWDDDLDLAMTRADFEHFRRVVPQELSEDFLYVDCREIGGFLDFMCRVMYMKETVPGNVFRKVEGRCREELPNHQPLDIFILDRIPDDPGKAARQILLTRVVYGLGMGHRAWLDRKEYQNRDWKTRWAVSGLSALGKLIPLSWIFRLHDRICTKYEKEETKDYFMSNSFLPFIQTRYACSWFTGDRRMTLGTMSVTVPSDPENSLKRTYYDFYHYPPVEKRIPEHGPDATGIH